MPIAVLLLVSLLRGVKVGIYFRLALNMVLFLVWDSQLTAFSAALVMALINTISILMKVFRALLLRQNMELFAHL